MIAVVVLVVFLVGVAFGCWLGTRAAYDPRRYVEECALHYREREPDD